MVNGVRYGRICCRINFQTDAQKMVAYFEKSILNNRTILAECLKRYLFIENNLNETNFKPILVK